MSKKVFLREQFIKIEFLNVLLMKQNKDLEKLSNNDDKTH
jgi:hypothetical protein